MTEKTPERTRLRDMEYYALLQVFGMVNNFNISIPSLEKRLRATPWGWTCARIIYGLCSKLEKIILDTIEAKSLMIVRRDIEHAKCEVRIRYDVGVKATEYTYVDASALNDVVSRLMNYDCYLCAKSGAEIGKCEIRKSINKLMPFEVATIQNRQCSLCGENQIWDKIQEKEKNK